MTPRAAQPADPHDVQALQGPARDEQVRFAPICGCAWAVTRRSVPASKRAAASALVDRHHHVAERVALARSRSPRIRAIDRACLLARVDRGHPIGASRMTRRHVSTSAAPLTTRATKIAQPHMPAPPSVVGAAVVAGRRALDAPPVGRLDLDGAGCALGVAMLERTSSR
ncbi:hypothetical protein OVA14_13180 [Agrococcus sp. SL85]|uniref:hypothetical protein n=1 Tax=Agrococcus sp. SL85 TaxID=2995141 RepID=UPI00226D0A8B|nr:hypothetical protein [Agrococcus sp. SL85]WAC66205.1 hypothetical protein OVA14_13180 [Agrococcus sp. SL85]